MKRLAAALLASTAIAFQPAYGQTLADSAKAAIGTSGLGLYSFSGLTALGYFDGTSAKPKMLPLSALELTSGTIPKLRTYDVVCTGTPNVDTAALNNAAQAVGTNGTVEVGYGTCAVNASLVAPSGVLFNGRGGANYGQCNTIFQWQGASGGTLFNEAAAANGVLVRVGITNACLDGNNGTGAIGINKRGVQNGTYASLYIKGFSSRGVYEDVSASTATVADQLSRWDRIYIDGTQGSSGSTASSAACWEIGSSAPNGGDVASNTYSKITCVHGPNPGFICGNSDGSTFIDFYALGTGLSFEAKAGTTTNVSACREHTFLGETVMAGGIQVDAGTSANGGPYPSFGIGIQNYKRGDGEPVPVIQSGAEMHYQDSYGNALSVSLALKSLTVSGDMTSNGSAARQVFYDQALNGSYSTLYRNAFIMHFGSSTHTGDIWSYSDSGFSSNVPINAPYFTYSQTLTVASLPTCSASSYNHTDLFVSDEANGSATYASAPVGGGSFEARVHCGLIGASAYGWRLQ